MPAEISKETALFWRQIVHEKEFAKGLQILRENNAPNVRGKTAEEMLREALQWGAYMAALSDLEEVLTKPDKQEKSIEEGPLNG